MLAAEESAGARTLQAVVDSGHELNAVLTASPESAVAREARRYGIPVLPAIRLKDPAFAAEVAGRECEVLLNVHSLYLVRAEILSAFSFGCFNLHPGPLPDYAGMNAPSWALLQGEPRHGVTLHWMTAGVDEGYIAYQDCFSLSDSDTGLSVSMRCITRGLDLVKNLLEALAADRSTVPRIPQDLARRRYFGRQKPHGGRVPVGMTAAELDRFVRASDYSPFPSPWGHPMVTASGHEVALVNIKLTGRPADAPAWTLKLHDGETWLATADEWVHLRRVMIDGRMADAKLLLPPGGEAS